MAELVVSFLLCLGEREFYCATCKEGKLVMGMIETFFQILGSSVFLLL